MVFMKRVFFVSNENKSRAELALKSDDEISRGSITVKSAASLGIEKDGYFIIIDAGEHAIKKAEELLKGVAEKYSKPGEVLDRVEEQENNAIEGFGNILG